jgi:virginiamycin A acetyltransferase
MLNAMKKMVIRAYARRIGVTITKDSNIGLRQLKNIGYKSRLQGGVSCHGLVKVGRYTSINGPNTQILSRLNRVVIGNFCSIAPGVLIMEFFHKHNRVTSYFINKHLFNEDLSCDIYSKGDIIIEDDVWIGANGIILSGVCVGRGSIVGAGSVVTKDIPRYSVVGGNPAKLIRSRFDRATIDFLESSRWWTWSEEKLQANKLFFSLAGDSINKYKIQ